MRWKPLLAVLLGLLMVGVTAGGAMAISWQTNSEKAHRNSYEPAGWGLTAQVTTIVKVDGQEYKHPQQFDNYRIYTVPKNSKGSFKIVIGRFPIGTYHVKIATNKGFNIYPSRVKSLGSEDWEYQGLRYNAGYPFYEFSTPHHGWWASSSFEVPVEFNERTGILVYGYMGGDPVESAISAGLGGTIGGILAAGAGLPAAVGALLGAVAGTQFSIDIFVIAPTG
ncbi:MAG: hypothetical protein J7L37_01625 [Thermococcus sp.]|nr:hypothetical protein [Thermococcus sp.]